MLRGLPADLVARLRAYATARGLTERQAAARILQEHLAQLEQRAAGAETVNARLTPEERSAAARRAVTARWARERATRSLEADADGAPQSRPSTKRTPHRGQT